MSWVTRAEAALDAGRVTSGTDQLLRGRRPMVLDAEGVKAVLAPLLASFFWAAAFFRELVAGSSLDPVGMVLRFLALGLTLRVILLGGTLLRRVSVFLAVDRYGLVLTPGGLIYRAPSHDIVVPKEDIVGITLHGTGQEDSASRGWLEVYVVTDPTQGRTHIALPPVFEDSPRLLAQRLTRWRGTLPEGRKITAKPADSASKVFDEAAKGILGEGTAVVHFGLGWVKTGPYALLLAGAVTVDALVRGEAAVWDAMEPWMAGGLFVAFLAIPARWLWITRREIVPRKGVAMVITPAEVIMRIPAGMLRARWKDLSKIGFDAKKKWSVLEGAHTLRLLVMTRNHAAPIRYEEPFLGIPVEVAQMVLDAYRTGRLPQSGAEASDEEE